MENGYIPLLQGGPEIKYRLQEEILGKGCLLVKPLGRPIGPHLHGELCALGYVTGCHSVHVGCGSHVLQDRSWIGRR